eukprot:1156454-Pelagomonas_calceolata.AAC.6
MRRARTTRRTAPASLLASGVLSLHSRSVRSEARTISGALRLHSRSVRSEARTVFGALRLQSRPVRSEARTVSGALRLHSRSVRPEAQAWTPCWATCWGFCELMDCKCCCAAASLLWLLLLLLLLLPLVGAFPGAVVLLVGGSAGLTWLLGTVGAGQGWGAMLSDVSREVSGEIEELGVTGTVRASATCWASCVM